MKIQFPRSYLAAAAQFMADRDIRYYLNGLYVEILAAETRLVGTDGHIAGVMRWPTENTVMLDVIIPAPTVAMAGKMKSEFIELERTADGWFLAGIRFTPVDGKFPEYRRIMIANPSGEAGNYNPELLMRFVKAGKALKLKGSPVLRQNGANGSALIHFYGFDNFVGIISPLRMWGEKMPDLGFPTWGAH